MLKKTLILFILFAVIAGCTRDDICPEGTPTTPRLIIKFMDSSVPSQTKAVTNLRVALTSAEEEQIFVPRTDTIFQIPLNPSLTTVQYTFTRNFNGADENSDNIRFRYEIDEDVYINRACSFKTTYTDLNALVRSEGAANSNWLKIVEITNETIENEDITHITVFH